jgi:hypothetical protein
MPVPFFSTIIPCYNRADLVARTLDSVFAQEFPDQEVLVVDDGSTDGTLDVLARYGGRLKVLHQANKGPGAARNMGLREARGDYVAFLDSDDLWFPWSLATYARVIRDHGAPAFLGGAARWFQREEELQQVRPAAVKVERFPDFLSTAARPLFFGMSWFVVRRDVLNEVGGLVDRWVNAEDVELRLRLGTAAGFCMLEEPFTLGYRVHPGNATLNVGRTFHGVCHMVRQEKSQGYPGGARRRWPRRRIITRHARTTSLDCLRAGAVGQGWALYRETLGWNLAQLRLRYLLAFPVLALAAWRRQKAPATGDARQARP